MSKKIGAIVSLVIIGLLIVVTIVMANVNVNYSIKCEKPDAIHVQHGSSLVKADQEEDFNKIMELIGSASKDNSLSALFTGKINKKAEITTVSTNSLTSIPSTSDYYVSYVYNNPQALMDGNKKYKDGDGEAHYYKELVFTVTKMDNEGEVRVYIKPYYTSNGTEYTGDSYYKYYTLTADFGDLYNYLQKDFNK